MTNEFIKEQLLKLEPNVEDFTVIQSGKKSKKVNGLYKPLTKEIILHNKNFSSDNQLIFTAIHEFAHHLQFSKTHKPISARVHTTQFWAIFHSLLNEAEKQGIYENLFTSHPDFISLTEKIKHDFIRPHGELIRAFGEILLKVYDLCNKHKLNFIDYVQRILKLPQSQALSLIKLSQLKLNPEIGYENMKTLARIRDEKQRKKAEKALITGASPAIIQNDFLKQKEDAMELSQSLEAEKQRLEKLIAKLQKRLNQIQERLSSLEEENRASLTKRNI